MLKILRYGIIILVVIVLISVLKGVGGAFKGENALVLGDSVSLPGFESPPEFVKNLTSAANNIIGNAVNSFTTSISNNVSGSIESKAIDEVTKNFNNLGDKEKEILKKSICQ